jgi:hypothetical protein
MSEPNRRLHWLAVTALLGLCLIGGLYAAHRLAPCRMCAAELPIGGRLGVAPSVTAIDRYLDRQLVPGKTEADVTATLDQIAPGHLRPYPPFGTMWNVRGARCFYAAFDDVMDGNRILNRYLCFDCHGVLVTVDHELGFWCEISAGPPIRAGLPFIFMPIW